MSRNKKILIIVLAVLLIAAIVYFLFFRKRKTEEVLQEGVLTLDGNTSPAQTWAVESFPLNKGMQGENVKRLQMAINRIGSTLQVISGNVAVDGKFGEETSAAVETQKGLARGIKEELEAKIPEIAGLNAEEKSLIRTLNVADRRALMELNKNPFGLAILAGDAASRAVFMADKSAAFKALLARMIYRSKEVLSKPQVTQNVQGLLDASQPYAAPAATGAGLLNNLPQ
jgi:lysozyme family protein